MEDAKFVVCAHLSMASAAVDMREAAAEFKRKHGECPSHVYCAEHETRFDIEGDCDTCGTILFDEEDSFHVLRSKEGEKMFCDKCFWIQGGDET